MKYKKILNIMPLFIFFIIVFSNTICAKNIVGNQKIKEIFPDHAIAKTITKILGKQSPDELINQYELNSITNFRQEGWKNASDKIFDISGIQYLNNLNEFMVIGSEISDLSPLSELTNLRSLSISYNKIIDISPLRNLYNITYLNLPYNSIINLNAISNLTKVEYLSVANNKIEDISPLERLKNLIALDISQNFISNLSPLRSLQNLSELNISFNPLNNLEILPQLKCVVIKCYDNCNNKQANNKKSILRQFFDWLINKKA
ncbi:MAG: hypothetical protein IJI84_04210 [Clostridia bacterium]|nr:hypothetical protein [Clostridia bacterium]